MTNPQTGTFLMLTCDKPFHDRSVDLRAVSMQLYELQRDEEVVDELLCKEHNKSLRLQLKTDIRNYTFWQFYDLEELWNAGLLK